LLEIKPQLLNLIESWKFDENSLLSVISKDKGKMSEELFGAAIYSRLNDKDSINGFNEYMKPMLKAKL